MTREEIAACFPPRNDSTEAQLSVRGDDLRPGLSTDTSSIPAAVLIPILLREAEPAILFTLRTPHLAAHAGQISFPGGRVDPMDRDSTATALREAREEIGLAADAVEIIGRLDRYITRTGYAIDPIVGFVDPNFIAEADPFEVAEVFEVPLDFLLIPQNRRTELRTVEDGLRQFSVFIYGKYRIWGATAGMLVNFIEVLRSRKG